MGVDFELLASHRLLLGGNRGHWASKKNANGIFDCAYWKWVLLHRQIDIIKFWRERGEEAKCIRLMTPGSYGSTRSSCQSRNAEFQRTTAALDLVRVRRWAEESDRSSYLLDEPQLVLADGLHTIFCFFATVLVLEEADWKAAAKASSVLLLL